MARLTYVSRRDMSGALACCGRTVVTGDAVTGDIRMIEIRRDPGRCRMTVRAGVPARNMIRCLAGCGRAVMTGRAGTRHLGMIDSSSRRPHVGVMAVFADTRRQDMSCGLAGSLDSVVAARTVAGDARVLECCRSPGNRRVAIVAVVPAPDMRRVFAGRGSAVVARGAGAEDLGVVDRVGRRPGIAVVA